MVNLRAFRKANDLTQTQVADYLGVGKSFISRIESGSVAIPLKKLSKLIQNPNGWDVSMLTDGGQLVGENNTGVVINGGGNNSHIDNRHYYSDSPDVLRAQIDILEERIKEKDAQIKEKDAQIKQLLDIIQGMKK